MLDRRRLPRLAALLVALALFALARPSADASPPSDEVRWSLGPDGRPTERQVVEITPPAPPLRIAILPDRTTGRPWGLEYLRAAVRDLERLQPDVIFTIGDMVQGYTRSIEQWDEEVEEWKAIVAPLSPAPLPVAGNHDVVSGSRDPRDDTFEERYRSSFGPLRYSANLPGATVVVGFSDGRRAQEGVAFSEVDLAWLDATLAAAAERGEPIILLMHRPMWRSASSRWSELVHPMLVRHGVDAVIAGHFHALQRDSDRDGVQYHILGSCGGMVDQHPLTGQLQHLTFVTVPQEGPLEVHHQIVGATIGADHVLREDQERANRLKQSAEAVRFLDPIAEPAAPGGRSSGRLRVELVNPLGVPINWTWRDLDSIPSPEEVPPSEPGAATWLSRTPVDTFNPFTMRIDSPLSIADGGPVEVPANGRTTVELDWTLAASATPIPPTEVRFLATFEDSRGRQVPITILRRVPVARTIQLIAPTGADAGSSTADALPIAAWTVSPYDTLEADPSVRFALDREEVLRIELEVPDQRLAKPVEDARIDRTRIDDPMLDAVRLQFGTGNSARTWLFELDADGTRCFTGLGEVVEAVPPGDALVPAMAWRRVEGGWQATVRVPATIWKTTDGDATLLQIGVADNDDTYHTQWRWLAPPGVPAHLRAR